MISTRTLRRHSEKGQAVKDAAGFIVCATDTDGIRKFLLLYAERGYWGFPKGKRHVRETLFATALRELREETGMNNFFVFSGFRVCYRYSFRAPDGRRIRKAVTLFAACAASRAVRLSEEHTAFVWLPFHRALSRLTYPSLKHVLRRFERHMRAQKKTIAFQHSVYRTTAAIPRGNVATYGDVARAARRPHAARVVGALLHKNYDAAIPCHRVVAAGGLLSGYNRGEAHKARLLRDEGVAVVSEKGKYRVAHFSKYHHAFS
ncbi:MAG: methylated-DNA--[protein]-cysteine S-methyltransferase [Patescibacteria group bacterium]